MMVRVEQTRAELLAMYRLIRSFDAIFDGFEPDKLAKPPPEPPPPLLRPLPLPPLCLF